MARFVRFSIRFTGADRITRFFLGVLQKLGSGWEVRPASVNSGPGLITHTDGQLSSVVSLRIEGDRIQAIYSVSNRDKLRSRSLLEARECEFISTPHERR
ncbi:MAG: hypothetical protein ACJ746_12115 [Bryobacteraceae bacterium]